MINDGGKRDLPIVGTHAASELGVTDSSSDAVLFTLEVLGRIQSEDVLDILISQTWPVAPQGVVAGIRTYAVIGSGSVKRVRRFTQ